MLWLEDVSDGPSRRLTDPRPARQWARPDGRPGGSPWFRRPDSRLTFASPFDEFAAATAVAAVTAERALWPIGPGPAAVSADPSAAGAASTAEPPVDAETCWTGAIEMVTAWRTASC